MNCPFCGQIDAMLTHENEHLRNENDNLSNQVVFLNQKIVLQILCFSAARTKSSLDL